MDEVRVSRSGEESSRVPGEACGLKVPTDRLAAMVAIRAQDPNVQGSTTYGDDLGSIGAERKCVILTGPDLVLVWNIVDDLITFEIPDDKMAAQIESCDEIPVRNADLRYPIPPHFLKIERTEDLPC